QRKQQIPMCARPPFPGSLTLAYYSEIARRGAAPHFARPGGGLAPHPRQKPRRRNGAGGENRRVQSPEQTATRVEPMAYRMASPDTKKPVCAFPHLRRQSSPWARMPKPRDKQNRRRVHRPVQVPDITVAGNDRTPTPCHTPFAACTIVTMIR